MYQLTIAHGTQFFKMHKNKLIQLPNDETSEKLYNSTIQIAKEHGLLQYEISNFARPSFECKHNIQYWKNRDFVGIGPGAHGRLTIPNTNERFSTVQIMSPDVWLTDVLENAQPESKRVINVENVRCNLGGNVKIEKLSTNARLQELFINCLRLNNKFPHHKTSIKAGISEMDLKMHSNGTITTFDQLVPRHSQLVEQGFLVLGSSSETLHEGKRLSCTEKGLAVLDHILPILFSS